MTTHTLYGSFGNVASLLRLLYVKLKKGLTMRAKWEQLYSKTHRRASKLAKQAYSHLHKNYFRPSKQYIDKTINDMIVLVLQYESYVSSDVSSAPSDLGRGDSERCSSAPLRAPSYREGSLAVKKQPQRFQVRSNKSK